MNTTTTTSRTTALAAVLLVAVGAGVGLGSADATAETPRTDATGEDAQTFTVLVDAHTEDNHGLLDAFFPNTLEAHPGDTIEFVLMDSGEPHTVALGTKADEAVSIVQEGPRPTDPVPVLFRAGLPFLFNVPGFDRRAANPCILTGDAVGDSCSRPDGDFVFTGQESLLGSGVLLPDQPFRVTLADDIEPGTYGIICLAHGAHMTGTLTVVDRDTPINSPEEVAAVAQQQLDEQTSELSAMIDTAERASTEAGVVIAGPTDASVPDVHAAAFVPEAITVTAGETVEWVVSRAHTVSFNWPEEAVGASVVDEDGTIRENPRFFEGVQPTASEWDGVGFFNSGVIIQPRTYSITFTRPGTYRYRCLIHHDMEGVVIVVEP